MALPATAVINCRSTATAGNLNGGGFNSERGGTDYSLQDTAQLTNTDGTGAGTTNFASVIGGFTNAMKGNYIHLTASTGLTVGWYEITAVVDTNNVTLDRSPGTGSATTYYVGGAMSLASTLDDELFEILVPGNICYVKGATYVLGEAVAISTAAGTNLVITVQGYTTTQGDACTGSQRPVFSLGTNSFTPGVNFRYVNMVFLADNSNPAILGSTGLQMKNCKATNIGTSANRQAISTNADTLLVDCEFVSYRGNAVGADVGTATIINCYIHDSNNGINSALTTVGALTITGNIIESCVNAAIKIAAAETITGSIFGNTLFGSTNTTGIGISIATGTTDLRVINNIITGFVSGVVHADTTQTVGYDNYNDYHNNDTDVTGWVKGPNDSAIAPSFTSVSQVTGATATTTAGNHLVQSGATFVTSGVTAGRDFVYIISGTGVTAGIYGILSVDSETQITADITLTANATADKVFQITTGRNFAIGTAMKALGFPGAFQGGYTTGYLDQGAAQRQEPAGGGGGSFGFIG